MKKSLVGVSLLTITCLYGLLSAVIILIALLTGQDIGLSIYISIAMIIIQFLIAPWSDDSTLREDESGEMLEAKEVLLNVPRHSGNYIEVPVVIGE